MLFFFRIIFIKPDKNVNKKKIDVLYSTCPKSHPVVVSVVSSVIDRVVTS